MPKINMNVINEKEIQENGKYEIVSVKDFKSPQNQIGLKVILKSLNENDTQKYSCILWTRDNAGIKSKIGAFIVALSGIDAEGTPQKTDTDEWIGEQILVNIWKEKDRKITVIS